MLPGFMKAIKHIEYGPPERLELTDLPRPSPGESEILIEVRAATVNRTDCAMMRAKPWIMRFVTGLWRPKKPVLGTDVAGTVVAAGAEVREFAVGDRVFGFNDVGLGSHAEYAVVSAGDALATIPDGVSFEQAAASLEGAHYAINFINKVSIARGQEILVNGATGAIGSAAVQLLVAMDVRVTAVCGTAGVASVTALGVERVIDYQKEDFTQLDTRFDHVFDCVGKSTFGRCKPLLKPKGVYISSELGPMAQNPWLRCSLRSLVVVE